MLSIIFMSAGIYHLVEQEFFMLQMGYTRAGVAQCYEEYAAGGGAGSAPKGCAPHLEAYELTVGDALYFLVVTI